MLFLILHALRVQFTTTWIDNTTYNRNGHANYLQRQSSLNRSNNSIQILGTQIRFISSTQKNIGNTTSLSTPPIHYSQKLFTHMMRIVPNRRSQLPQTLVSDILIRRSGPCQLSTTPELTLMVSSSSGKFCPSESPAKSMRSSPRPLAAAVVEGSAGGALWTIEVKLVVSRQCVKGSD